MAAAASLLSDYRRSSGLPSVSADQKLVAIAADLARRMAAADNLTHDPGGRGLTQRLTAANYSVTRAAENIGAGYHTLAEAFSGWRDSPSHNTNMLMSGVTRFGIATAYSPRSKYKVFWALILRSRTSRASVSPARGAVLPEIRDYERLRARSAGKFRPATTSASMPATSGPWSSRRRPRSSCSGRAAASTW